MILLLAVGPASATGDEEDPFVVHIGNAETAFEARSFLRMLAEAERAEAERPGHPRAVYTLAVAHAHAGQADAAIAQLQRLVRKGLSHDLPGDERLSEVRDHPGYEELSAQLADNDEARGVGVKVLTHPTRRFIPEGLAYDRDTNRYFLSSVYRREIVIPGETGGNAAFLPPAAYGMYAAMGMFAEPARRLLWVASAALPQMKAYAEDQRGLSRVYALDMDSGRISRKFDAPADVGPHAFGDITVGRRGEVFVSDSLGGRVYAVDRISGSFTSLDPKGLLKSPQGLAQSRDRKKLFIADYSRGLFVHDADSQQLSKLTVPDEFCDYGLDGMALYRGDLLAIQNGIKPNRVVRIQLNEERTAVTAMDVLLANDPDFSEPTQGVVNGRSFYLVANSQWALIGDDNRLPAAGKLQRPVILRIPLN